MGQNSLHAKNQHPRSTLSLRKVIRHRREREKKEEKAMNTVARKGGVLANVSATPACLRTQGEKTTPPNYFFEI